MTYNTMLLLRHRFYRFLWCLLLVGTTAWIPSITTSPRACYRSNAPRFLAIQQNHHSKVSLKSHKKDSDCQKRPSRIASWRKRFKRHSLSYFVALAVALKGPGIASAVPAPAKPTFSIPPGISKEQAQALVQGSGNVNLDESSFSTPGGPQPNQEKEAPAKAEKRKNTFDYGEDEEDEDDDMLEGEQLKAAVASYTGKVSMNKPTDFAYMPKEKDNMIYVKAFAGSVFPVLGFGLWRGWWAENRNQKKLKTALEIMKAQEAEYFNVTSSANVTDADIEDALKGIKNETATDEDEEDEDDEDEDDEDDEGPPPPKKPRGGGGGGDNGGDSGDSDGPPSDEDLARLNSMFKKS